ncbi:hypothetical protein VTG60DRAFT_2810 [Thermothelomyces hinnuleus]
MSNVFSGPASRGAARRHAQRAFSRNPRFPLCGFPPNPLGKKFFFPAGWFGRALRPLTERNQQIFRLGARGNRTEPEALDPHFLPSLRCPTDFSLRHTQYCIHANLHRPCPPKHRHFAETAHRPAVSPCVADHASPTNGIGDRGGRSWSGRSDRPNLARPTANVLGHPACALSSSVCKRSRCPVLPPSERSRPFFLSFLPAGWAKDLFSLLFLFRFEFLFSSSHSVVASLEMVRARAYRLGRDGDSLDYTDT